MLSNEGQMALIGWKAHGPRLMAASYRTKKQKIKFNLIQSYAPTNDGEEEKNPVLQ